MQKKRIFKRLFKLLFLTILFSITSIAIFAIMFPFDLKKLKELKAKRSSVVITDKKGKPLRAFCGKEGTWTFWVPIEKIPKRVQNAFIAVEDKRFYSHYGFDPIAVTRAAALNIICGHRVSGASTLTMQTIRMLTNNPRTYINKCKETFKAVQLESLLSKDEILEYYLNLCPFGGNIYGIESASQIYFGKSCKDLNLAEAALIAGLPKSPTAYRPDKAPEKAVKRRDFVLKRMFKSGYITEKEYNEGLKTELILAKRKRYFKAPHFAEFAKRNAEKGQFTIETTIDSEIQEVAKFALQKNLEKFPKIHNGSIVIIENSTSKIRAMVGSPNFFDKTNCGEVNVAISARSPGSTLKPFLFAKAFEDGLLIPSSKMNDKKININGYSPMNFDKEFRGSVTAREALVNSYNIPAVNLLKHYGTGQFISLLKDCGISTINRSPTHYGLPIILGAAEVNLLELTAAYTIFPNEGVFRDPIFIKNQKNCEVRIFSPSTVDMINDILKDKNRLPIYSIETENNIEIAWKTGTSFGFHDAWTIAWTPNYTVGVWLGNAKGSSSPNLIGIKSAAPLALTIVKQVSAITHNKIAKFAKHFVEIEVSAKNGLPATSKDKNTITAIAPPNYICYKQRSSTTKQKLTITSPEPGEYLRINNNATLTFSAKSTEEKLFWFIDGRFIKSSKNEESFCYNIQTGNHKITCTTTNGVKNSMFLTIK